MPRVEQKSSVGDDQAGRIDRIVQILSGRSRADVRGLFDHDCIELNGSPCSEPGTVVKPGDVVVARYDTHRRYHARPRNRTGNIFRVVFEDDFLVVVDKAAPFLTVPTSRHETNTVIDALNEYIRRRQPRVKATAVHRLDRGTSGLLVFGKTPQIARELQDQFRERKTEREYVAIVAGELMRPEGTFSTHLGTTKSLQRYSVGNDEEGELAVTHYKAERRLNGATYTRVWLETGRRNQIRVHFAEAGHPVLGDKRYRPELAQHPKWTARRLALHAVALGFQHPRTKKEMTFESPLPEEFVHFLNKTSGRTTPRPDGRRNKGRNRR